MFEQQYRVRIFRDPYTDATNIAIIIDGHDGPFIAKPVKLEFHKFPEGGVIEPTIRVSASLLPALKDGILKFEGVRGDEEAKLAGLLQATRYHLEDMRRIALKLPKEAPCQK